MADVFVDAHWIGGNPARDELYGVAAWAPSRGVLFLRNPGNTTQIAGFHPARVLEMPKNVPLTVRVHCKYASTSQTFSQRIFDKSKDVCGDSSSCILKTNMRYAVRLPPLEVMVIVVVPLSD